MLRACAAPDRLSEWQRAINKVLRDEVHLMHLCHVHSDRFLATALVKVNGISPKLCEKDWRGSKQGRNEQGRGSPVCMAP